MSRILIIEDNVDAADTLREVLLFRVPPGPQPAGV